MYAYGFIGWVKNRRGANYTTKKCLEWGLIKQPQSSLNSWKVKKMNKYQIVTDSREQLPLWSGLCKGLKVGDYSLEGYEEEIAIERKSLADLAGTLGKGHPRFRRELDKAKDYKYFAIVIEGSATKLEKKQWYQSHRCKMKGFVLAKILFTLHVKYGINVFFAENRSDARVIIRNIFTAYLKTKEEKN